MYLGLGTEARGRLTGSRPEQIIISRGGKKLGSAVMYIAISVFKGEGYKGGMREWGSVFPKLHLDRRSTHQQENIQRDETSKADFTHFPSSSLRS
jgi:hypothetical protein